MVKPINHGTASGAQVHRNRGGKPCADCLAAEAAYMREYRKSGSAKVMARIQQTAYRRALQEVAKLHPVEYAQAYDRQLAKAKSEARTR